MRISDWSSDVCSSDLVDDLADACVHLLKTYSGQDHVNVGYGDDVTILELAETVKDVVGFEGEIVLDSSKPDGTPRKLMAADRLRALGWHPSTSLRDGITRTYAAFVAQLTGCLEPTAPELISSEERRVGKECGSTCRFRG